MTEQLQTLKDVKYDNFFILVLFYSLKQSLKELEPNANIYHYNKFHFCFIIS